MEIEKINKVFLLGIGGIGMSALARYFNTLGKEVRGYDKTPSPITDDLLVEGCEVFFEDDITKIPKEFIEEALCIYTPAIKEDNAIYKYVKENGNVWRKRAEILGVISKGSFTIAVAGTHGKTTTSSIVAHLLHECGVNFTAFLGGIASSFGSNYVRKTDGKEVFEDKEIMVVEADEYDRSFLQLSPDIAILTSSDADHLDIYKEGDVLKESFKEFLSLTRFVNIIHEQTGLSVGNTISYGKTGDVHYDLENNVSFGFTYYNNDVEIHGLKCGLPGIHNLENSIAAITALLSFLPIEAELKAALLSFKGVRRRFDIVYDKKGKVVIDDYAHHPTELRSFIGSVKTMYPNKQITGIFQPHLYSRTKDFKKDFAESLDLLDDAILLPIYPARELPIAGVTSEMLLGLMKLERVQVLSKEKALETVKESMPEILLIMGAGDIDRIVAPIKHFYEGQ